MNELNFKPVDWVFVLIHIMIIAVISIYAFFYTDRGRSYDELKMPNQWVLNGQHEVKVSDVSVKAGEGDMVLANILPDDIDDNSSLCFIGHNAFISVSVDGRLIYAYDSPINLIGRGYGNALNKVRLKREYAGKPVTISISSVFEKSGSGYIRDVYVGVSDSYVRNKLRKTALPALLSAFIVFFGILLIAIFFVVPDKKMLPYNPMALGIAAVMLGIWCIVKSGHMQLITGDVIFYRTFEYLAILLAEYPIMAFAYTFTHQRRRVYSFVIFGIWIVFVTIPFVLRFAFSIDMHNLIGYFYATYVLVIVFIIILFADNKRYCRANGIETDYGYFFKGAMCFVIGAAIDAVCYASDVKHFETNGTFIRLGILLFIFEMLLHFLKWWSSDRDKLISYGYNDIMTGTLNRRAFEAFEKMFDPSQPYGYIMCDINGLKVANDTLGHEAGDELIKVVAGCLIDTFGKENVYRIGGDEFVVISRAPDKKAFDNEIAEVKRRIEENDKSASLGCVYSDNGEHTFEEVMEQADKLMYEAKKEFYKTRDRRKESL